MAAKKVGKKLPSIADILNEFGIDAICERIENGDTQAEIAADIGITPPRLSEWLHREEHAARFARAKELSAEAWLDRGLAVLRDALPRNGPTDPSAAKAYAQECARRAALRNPKYVEKTAHELSGPNGGPIPVASHMTDEQLMAIAARGGKE